MTVAADELLAMLLATGPMVLALLVWQAMRYRIPPEIVAVVGTIGLPIAGLWRAELLPFVVVPSTALWLGVLVMISLVAIAKLPVKSSSDAFLLGLLAGALPAALVVARAAKTPRDAGRLAVVAAGAAAMSPLGGPVQWMLAGPSLDWWLASAPAGALAAALCWSGNELGGSDEPKPSWVRIRWLVAALWLGGLLQIVGVPWAVAKLTASPPSVGPWAWTLAAWLGGNAIDPWLIADLGVRSISLGASGEGLRAAIVGLTVPNLTVLLMAWWGSSHRAVLAGLPAVLAATALAVMLVASGLPG